MTDITQKEIWFITGSQHLYGDETLKQVAANSQNIVEGLNRSNQILINIVFKPIVTTPNEITSTIIEANAAPNCIGIIAWMHTFSPAKMWISGLKILNKPICHLHTQFNAEIPWKEIDMDFMNLNQSAHGDREFGHILTRLQKNRKIIVGHWQDDKVIKKINIWSRVALGFNEMQNLKIARIGDNMRDVAVTEGDKVEAQLRFGFSVNGYGLGDLTSFVNNVSDEEIKKLISIYGDEYKVSKEVLKSQNLYDAAKIEIGLKNFLEHGNFKAFTTTFENLYGLTQLPGIAVQRLMKQGYGFAAEGDWKTAAMVRVLKVMATGMDRGTSFMEDYTYHFTKEKSYVLGSHMLEICPSISDHKPSCEVHPLGIGGKEDPARLVFNAAKGNAINVSLVDLGHRFRFIVNEVEAVEPLQDLPKLPVARVFWEPKPNLDISATTWMLAGGAHHTVYTQAITTEFMEDLAEILNVELLVIDNKTTVRDFKNTLKTNEVYYSFNNR